jgi:hypothetical protein
MKLNPKADFAKFTRLGISPKRAKLDEGTRWQLAGEAIEELRRHDGGKSAAHCFAPAQNLSLESNSGKSFKFLVP